MALTLTNGQPFVGMPAEDTLFIVLKVNGDPWGQIRCGGPCRDDYKRIEVAHAPDGHAYVKLQHAALESFQAACKAVGFWIETTGTWRSCELAHDLYAKDPHRYAPPDKGAHMRGLAIDVTTAYGPYRRYRIRKELKYRGWHQARPDDEPWHFSFGLQV